MGFADGGRLIVDSRHEDCLTVAPSTAHGRPLRPRLVCGTHVCERDLERDLLVHVLVVEQDSTFVAS